MHGGFLPYKHTLNHSNMFYLNNSIQSMPFETQQRLEKYFTSVCSMSMLECHCKKTAPQTKRRLRRHHRRRHSTNIHMCISNVRECAEPMLCVILYIDIRLIPTIWWQRMKRHLYQRNRSNARKMVLFSAKFI